MLVALLALTALSACESCGSAVAVPVAVDAGRVLDPWTVRSELTLALALGDAQAEATRLGKRVLLVFIAFADPDSESVVRALSERPARLALARGYVHLFVNVGREGIGHVQLRHAHDVRKLATLVVLEASGRRVARQTFSPVSDQRALSSATLAQWLSAPRGR